ncbi:MAG TPA: MFS transporter [Ktedonobacteraceae bacterium]|nr:MFS transporter [Ktedonobacteraceae bacterium]
MSTLQIGPGHRYLEHYPDTGRRVWYLALAVVATIMLYYESYILPSVSTLVITTFKMNLSQYVLILLGSNLLGAGATLLGSLSDRIGRSNLIVYGLLVTGIGTILVPLTQTLGLFLLVVFVLGFVEGVILIATPALVRDFSPRFGRAMAMGFWTVGPVGGSFLATTVASQTLPIYGNWQSQYVIGGIVGLIIFLLSFLFLRELSPGLRDQIMNTVQEKELVESRASSIDVEGALRHPWRQMLKPRLLISSVGISVFLLMYYAAVGYFPLYLNAIFKFSLAEANGLVSIYWAVNVVAAVLFGFFSDRLHTRKPFMALGGITTIIVTILFISRIGVPTSGPLMVVFLSLFGFSLAVGYVTWLALFTENLEEINPALIATGLAIQGAILRLVVVLSIAGFVVVVVNPLNGSQWATWWWVCAVGAAVFLPTIFTLSGTWRPMSASTAVQIAVPVAPTSEPVAGQD